MAVTAANIVAGGASVLIGTDLGAIKEGVSLTLTVDTFTVDLEQEVIATKAFKTRNKLTCEFTLCEPTLENIKIGWDVDNAITAGPPRLLSAIDQQFTLQERIIVVTGTTPGYAPFLRTCTLTRAVLETPGVLVFTKAAEQNMKLGFNCLADGTAKAVTFSDAQA